MLMWCPRCGAHLPTEFKGQWFETSPRCRQCGVAVEAPAMLAPSEGEMTFSLADRDPSERAGVTALLQEDGIPYRWEAGFDLVVPGTAAMAAKRAMDEAPAIDPGATEAWPEPNGADGGEAAAEAMGDLFVAAADLRRNPYDPGFKADFVDAAEAAQGLLPPYGIDPDFWGGVQRLARDIADLLLADADGETVAPRATELRDALRDYV
ncbi:MAG TPA: hypothetical protein VM618_01845 [Acidimicrobiia bacterium]|nr:hypothetical protein [Acidimicrobiia bacterium]